MMNKKAVSGVIVTVLLILLVIAAVGILWVVIQRFVTDTTEDIPSATACIETDLEISAYTDTSVTIKRVAGNAEIKEIKVVIGGSSKASSGFGAGLSIGETVPLTTPIANGNVIEVAAVIGDTTCTIADTKTAEGLAA